ncbi:hypothetical protein [Streptosporangium saharense]|uniref:hypothetical protein n=1 Tax=Streptosporangium saharense TaxID=1706840 RepID=UPI00331AE462
MAPPLAGDAEAVNAAQGLRMALAEHRIEADVHHGYGLALVSVWAGLNVWCYKQRFWWRVGWNPDRQRVLYNWHPAAEPARAARRIAFHYADLRKRHARSEEAPS